MTDGDPHTHGGRRVLGPGGFDIRAWLAQLPRDGWTAAMLEQLREQIRFEISRGRLVLPAWVWESEAGIPEEE